MRSDRCGIPSAWIRIATEISEVMNTLDPEVAARRDGTHARAPDAGEGDADAPLGPGMHGDTGLEPPTAIWAAPGGCCPMGRGWMT
jgi:hypothetical protein